MPGGERKQEANLRRRVHRFLERLVRNSTYGGNDHWFAMPKEVTRLIAIVRGKGKP